MILMLALFFYLIGDCMRPLIFFVISIACLAITPANAQAPRDIEIYKTFNDATPPPNAAILISEIMKSALETQKSKGGCLPSSAVVDMVTPATAARFVTEGFVARQIRNAWTVIVRHPNCGSDIVRYAVVKQFNDSHYAFRINRGQSNANESLIGDTMPKAALVAALMLKRAGKDCRASDVTLGVTRIAEEGADLGPDLYGARFKGSWREIWPIIACGRTVEVSVRFEADGEGGAYTNVKENESTLLPEAR
jgi:hypothetical protein